MKKLELDLNKLSDNQIKKYLELKEALGLVEQVEVHTQSVEQIVDEEPAVLFRSPKRKRKVNKWTRKVEKLEPYLNKPRTRGQILRKMVMKEHGGNYKTLGRYLALVYRRRLKTISIGRSVFYQLEKEPLREDEIEPKIVKREAVEENIYDVVHELIKTGEATSFPDAFKRATGYGSVGGQHYDEYRKYCENLGEDFPTRRGRAKKEKKAPTHKKYMLRKNPYLLFKNKHLKKVMEVHNLTVQDATKYLSAAWMKSGKNPEQADEKVFLEIKTEMIEEPYEKKIEISKEISLPTLKNLKPRFGKVLIDMINHIKENQDLKLSFEPEGRMLGIDMYFEWSDFCRDFLEKSRKISYNLGIEDKFVLVGFGKNGMAIEYRGG